MSKALITEQTLTDIANNIRSNSTAGTMTPAEMSEKIKNMFPLDIFFTKDPYEQKKDEVIINCPMYESTPVISNNYKMKGTNIANHIYLKFFSKVGSSVDYKYFLEDTKLNKITIDISNSASLDNSSGFHGFAYESSVREVEVIKSNNQEAIIPEYMFYGCKNLTKITGFNSTIEKSAFYNSNITEDMFKTLNITSETIAKQGAFGGCLNLVNIDCTNITKDQKYSYLFDGSFANSNNLESAYFPMPANLNSNSTLKLGSGAFNYTKLSALIITITSKPAILLSSVSNTFSNTPIASGTGYIYVPDSLVDSYKTSTNQTTIANQIKPISELPEKYKTIYNL